MQLAVRAARAIVAVLIVVSPHGDEPTHYLSPRTTVQHLYPYPESHQNEHYAYTLLVALVLCTSLVADTHAADDRGGTAAGVIALVTVAVLPTFGVYLAHSTNHGNSTSAGIGVWLTIVFAQLGVLV